MRLAGKRILWNMVPCDEEEHYDDYVMTLYAQGVLTPNEWLDLGGLSSLSAEEYFGASLWQLYKSIDSPYKAVLKTLLLEAYSWEYPTHVCWRKISNSVCTTARLYRLASSILHDAGACY
ncbi:class I adenylate cyclase [Shigella flexneri]